MAWLHFESLCDYYHNKFYDTLPYASGIIMAIQCAWNLDPSVNWNATGGRIVGIQCVSSMLLVVFQCVPIMRIYTGLPLVLQWVLASASVVPVTSNCTCQSCKLTLDCHCKINWRWHQLVWFQCGSRVVWAFLCTLDQPVYTGPG